MQNEHIYQDRAAMIALRSQISAIVLLNEAASDCEFIPFTPLKLDDAEVVRRIAGRHLRSVGIVAASGGVAAACAFKEPLSSSVLSLLAAAFADYAAVATGEDCREAIAEAFEVEILERWLALPDTRT